MKRDLFYSKSKLKKLKYSRRWVMVSISKCNHSYNHFRKINLSLFLIKKYSNQLEVEEHRAQLINQLSQSNRIIPLNPESQGKKHSIPI